LSGLDTLMIDASSLYRVAAPRCGPLMARDKHEPVQALISIAGNELDALRWLHVEAA
jgi:hypothetical protein